MTIEVHGVEVHNGGMYFIDRPNPFGFPTNTYFRRFDDGFERCIVASDSGKLEVLAYEGMVIPHQTLGPYLQRIQKFGLDMGSVRYQRRKRLGD